MSPQQILNLAMATDVAARQIQKAYRGYKSRKYAKKPPKRQMKKQPAPGIPKYRVGAAMGTFGKKGRTPKPIQGIVLKETHITSPTQTVASYVGMPYIQRDRLVLALAMHMTQDIAKRSGLCLSSWQSIMVSNAYGGGRMTKLRMEFKKIHVDGSTSGDTFDITPAADTTWILFAHNIKNEFMSQAENGFFPTKYRLYDTDSKVFYDHNNFDNDIVTMNITSIVKIQNTTPAADGNDSINAVDANPLMGRVYDFKHMAPRLRSGYMTEMQSVTGFTGMSQISSSLTNQKEIQTQHLRNGGLITGTLATAFAMPPNGAAVFENCDGAKDIKMPPGGFYTIKRTHKCVASVKRYLHGSVDFRDPPTYSDGIQSIRAPIVSKCWMVGLRPMLPTGLDESIRLAMSRDSIVKVQVRRAKLPNAPVYNNLND